MPHGLVIVLSIFQDFMHEVLWEYLHSLIVVYINDILVYSQSMAIATTLQESFRI